jgi:hypothetical protein
MNPSQPGLMSPSQRKRLCCGIFCACFNKGGAMLPPEISLSLTF